MPGLISEDRMLFTYFYKYTEKGGAIFIPSHTKS